MLPLDICFLLEITFKPVYDGQVSIFLRQKVNLCVKRHRWHLVLFDYLGNFRSLLRFTSL